MKTTLQILLIPKQTMSGQALKNLLDEHGLIGLARYRVDVNSEYLVVGWNDFASYEARQQYEREHKDQVLESTRSGCSFFPVGDECLKLVWKCLSTRENLTPYPKVNDMTSHQKRVSSIEEVSKAWEIRRKKKKELSRKLASKIISEEEYRKEMTFLMDMVPVLNTSGLNGEIRAYLFGLDNTANSVKNGQQEEQNVGQNQTIGNGQQ